MEWTVKVAIVEAVFVSRRGRRRRRSRIQAFESLGDSMIQSVEKKSNLNSRFFTAGTWVIVYQEPKLALDYKFCELSRARRLDEFIFCQ